MSNWTHNEVEKWFAPSNDVQRQVFRDAHDALEFFLRHRGEGVELDYVEELMERHTGMKIPFRDMGFVTFKDFLFHCDEIFELRTDGEGGYYLFFRGCGLRNVRARNFHMKGDSCLTVPTVEVSSDTLVKKNVDSWLIANYGISSCVSENLAEERVSPPHSTESQDTCSKPSTAPSSDISGKSISAPKQLELNNSCWSSVSLVDIDSYGYIILRSSDTKEIFEDEMTKLNTFYSSPQHQNKYRVNMDEMTAGSFVVIQDEDKFLRAKIFKISSNKRLCICRGVDDFEEHVINCSNIYHIKCEFSKVPARMILCVLDGTEHNMFEDNIALAFQLVKDLHDLRLELKVKVIQDWHPLFHAPIVQLKTMEGENFLDLIQPYSRDSLRSTGSSVSFSLSDHQKFVLAELEQLRYFFEC